MFILGKLHWVSEFAVGIFEIYMRFDEKVSFGTLFFVFLPLVLQKLSDNEE